MAFPAQNDEVYDSTEEEMTYDEIRDLISDIVKEPDLKVTRGPIFSIEFSLHTSQDLGKRTFGIYSEHGLQIQINMESSVCLIEYE